MVETVRVGRPTTGRSLMDTLRDLANVATVWGVLLLLGGLLMLGLPGVSVVTVELAFGAAVLVVGLLDLWYAVSGRGPSLVRSRVLAAARAPVLVALAVLVLIEPDALVSLLIFVVGGYLFLRGLATVLVELSRRRPHWTGRVATGATVAAFGALSATAPAVLSDGLVLFGAVAAVVIGAILLAHGIQAAGDTSIDLTGATVPSMMWDWVRSSDVGNDRRERVSDGLYFEPPERRNKLAAWWVMLLLSAAIATYAILLDSTAVVIGAMLVAPLMVPILGLAAALVNGWSARATASSWLVLLGAGGVIALSYLLARWAPSTIALEANTQISSRVDPTLLDLLIAVAAGAAGAFATVNVRVAPSIAGVAIAVALVPPLSVVGITLGAGMVADAREALLLFLTNFVAIVFSASVVFVLGGFADSAVLRARPRELLVTMTPFAALALAVLVPLVFTSRGLVADTTLQGRVVDEAERWLGDRDLRVVQVAVDSGDVTVEVTGSADLPPVGDLHDALTDGEVSPATLTVSLTPSRTVVHQGAGR